MAQKRVKLGKGWRVSQSGQPEDDIRGLLVSVQPGYVVKPGDICERGGIYFRLAKKGLKWINPKKGRAIVGIKMNHHRFGIPPQPKRWLPDPFDEFSARKRAIDLIRYQCRIHSVLKLKNGKIEVISKSGEMYCVCIKTARVTDSDNKAVCVVTRGKTKFLPVEDIALAKALTIAYGSQLVDTIS